MPSKKKSKPSFNVPEDLQAAPQAGWVYRSDGESKPAARKPEEKATTSAGTARASSDGDSAAHEKKTPAPAVPSRTVTPAPSGKPPEAKPAKPSDGKSKTSSKSDSGILDLASKTIYSGFETLGNAVRLTARIVTAPISMGMRLIGLKSK